VQLKVSGTGRRVVAAAGVVAVATAGAVIARADDQDARSAQTTGGLAISPAKIERAAAAGAANAVTVANNSRQTLTVSVKARPWTQSSSGLASPNRRRTLSGVTISDDSFTLAAGAKRDVTVTLGGAPAGGSLYGALEIIGLPRNAATRKGVVTGYRLIGALRYNPVTPRYALSASSAKVSKGMLVLPIRNTGNTAEPVTGTVRLRGALGTRQSSIRATRILPRKRVSVPLASTKGLRAGRYTATVSLRQGTERINITKRIRVRR
jgi:hypothetical protein